MNAQSNILQNLHLIGLSHWNTPVDIREQFSLSKAQTVSLYEAAKQAGINSIFTISTCNRTEIYALTEHAEKLAELLLNFATSNTRNKQIVTRQLNQYKYIKKSNEAVQHLLNVASGLDAQILGDAQVTGQIREFHQLALQHNALDATLNRLIEQTISVGKKVKTQTQLNAGASTIAHAAVRRSVEGGVLGIERKERCALIVGAGKTGRLVLKSLLKELSSENITVVNRTDANSIELANEFSVNAAEYAALKNEIAKADVIFTATASTQPIITTELLRGVSLESKLFIDLSLPRNIEPTLNAPVVSIDQLTDSNNQQREQYLKVAEQLITAGIAEYYEWLSRYELAQNVKSHIAQSIFDNGLDDDETNVPSKFVDGITHKHLKHFQKGKQSRNLAA